MSVVAAGVMCYLTMDKRLVEVVKTITCHISAFPFLIVIDFVYSYPTLSKIIHCLVVSLTCTKFKTSRIQKKWFGPMQEKCNQNLMAEKIM